MSEAGVRTENFVCPNCGGTMKWNIRKQQFECASCRVPGEIKTIGDGVIEHDFEGYSRRDREKSHFKNSSVLPVLRAVLR